MKHTTKNSLSEFNIEEARGWIIDRMLQIEHQIDAKIIEYYKPEKKEEFKKIILNSSVLDIGSKCKILQNIPGIQKKTIEDIMRITSIRNGFAHASINEIIRINAIPSENDIIYLEPVSEVRIEKMNSSGKLQSKIAYDYLIDFFDLYKKIRDLL